MLKNFDEFVRFCSEHGGALRNHKQFGEMVRVLRAQIAADQQRKEGIMTDTPEEYIKRDAEKFAHILKCPRCAATFE